MQPIFPGEGTRKTPAPVTDTLEQGVGGDLEPTYNYFLEDRITGDTYEVHLPPLSVTANGTIIYYTTSVATLTATTTTEPVYQGIFISGGWDVYVRNGALATEQSPNGIGIVYGICDFGPIPSICTVFMADRITGETFLVDFSVSPPTLTLAATDVTPVFDAVLVNDGWFLVVMGVGSLFSTLTAPAGNIFSNDCIIGHVQIDGNGEGGGVTPLPTPSCTTDTLLIFDNFETEICPTPNLLTFDDFETEFCPTPDLLIFDNFET